MSAASVNAIAWGLWWLFASLAPAPGPPEAAPPRLPRDPFVEGEPLPMDGPVPPAPTPPAMARLHGRIAAMGSRDPVSNARLVGEDGAVVIETDAQGRFAAEVSPGRRQFRARAPGFQDWTGTVDLAPGQDTELRLRLLPDGQTGVYRTVVEDERQVAVSRRRLRGPEIHDMPGTFGDPLRVPASLPGTAPLAGFLPYLVVRGAAPGNTGYYLDGNRLPILFHVAVGPSVIHPYFIDAVDFYPSGAPVRLGRYVSGMVEGRTKSAQRDRVHGDVELKLTDAAALVEIPFNRPHVPGCTPRLAPKCRRGKARGALTLAGRYSYTGLLLRLVPTEITIGFWDYQARLDHRIARGLEYTGFAYGSYDNIGQKPYTDADTGERIRPDPLVRFQFHRLVHRLRQSLPEGGSMTYGVALGLDQSGLGDVQTHEWTISPRIDGRVTLSPRLTLGFGIDEQIQVFRVPSLGEGTEASLTESIGFFLNERTVVASGVYADLRWRKGIMEMRPGIRIDHYLQVGASPYVIGATATTSAWGVDPRLLMREQVTERVALRQTIGVYHQPPSPPVPIPGIESFGFDRGLQRNVQGSFGYELELLSGRLQLEQEAYVGRFSNLQDFTLAEVLETSTTELEDVLTEVDGWAYGLETLLRLDPSLRTFGWIAYTLSRSTRDYPVGGRAPSEWDQRHIFNLVLGYRLGTKWNIGGRLHYHTGRPWTAPRHDQSAAGALAENRNNARLPAFFQLDVRLQRNWMFKRWQLQGIIEVLNATYSREVFQCEPDFIEQPAGGMIAAQLTPSMGHAECSPLGFRYIIPSLGLRARF